MGSEATLSRLEARLALEAAVEARFPRLCVKKPIILGNTLDLYQLHQLVLRCGGYRRVEQDNLWGALAAALPGSSGGTPSGGDPSVVRLVLREKALRFLAWIEDEADPLLVLQLQSHARRSEAVPMSDAQVASLPPALRGGTAAELPAYVYETSPAYLDFVAGAARTSAAEGAAGGPLAGSKRSREPATGASAAAPEAAPPAAEDTAEADDVADEPPLYPPPPFSVWLPESQHADDALALYRVHAAPAQAAGAVGGGLSPAEITDEEEVAFPAFSRAAHAATLYTDAQRRSAVRTSAAICVVPVGAEFVGHASPAVCRLLPEEDADAASVARLNAQAAAMIANPPGSRPPLAVCPAYALDVVAAMQPHVPGWPSTVPSTVTPELRKRVGKADPVLLRILEGVPEQEPWIGSGVGRTQLYLDVRNHVLLKWKQQKLHTNADSQRDVATRGPAATSGLRPAAADWAALLQRGCVPSHPSWNPDASYAGTPAALAALHWDAYPLPDAMTLDDVICTLPVRYHELTAAVFEFLEAAGKINFGALRLPSASFSDDDSTAAAVAQPASGAVRAGDRAVPKLRKRVVVIGAGMAGLAAARQLMFFGHDVLVLEARGRPGGRICTNRDDFGVPIDEGAMISSGEEPNPFALVARQLGFRTHRISNLQSPLLLPRRYAGRVRELARSRAACAPLMDALRKQLGGSVASGAPSTRSRPAAVVASATSGASFADTPESLYNPAGRLAFNLRVPADLSHLSNDVVRQAIRVQTAHASLMAVHVSLLRRLIKCVTALGMAQVHDHSLVAALHAEAHAVGRELDASKEALRMTDDPSEQYEPSYGVLLQGRALPPETAALLEALQRELDAALAWLLTSVSDRTAELLRFAMEQRKLSAPAALPSAPSMIAEKQDNPACDSDAAIVGQPIRAESSSAKPVAAAVLEDAAGTAIQLATALSHPALVTPPSTDTVTGSSSSFLQDITSGAQAATDDDPGLPWIVSVPRAIDEEVEEEFNSLMEGSSTVRRRSRPPESGAVCSSFPLLLPIKLPALPLLNPSEVDSQQDATDASSTMLSALIRDTYANGLKAQPATLQRAGGFPAGVEAVGNEAVSALYYGHGTARPAGTPTKLPLVDPHEFKFVAANDGSLKSGSASLGLSSSGWSVSVYPGRRMEKYYADPRRCDDAVDGAYDTGPDDDSDLVLPLASGGQFTLSRPGRTSGAAPTRRPVGPLVNTTPLGTARRVNFGHRWQWDMPLGHVLDFLATQADRLLLSGATQVQVPFPQAAVYFAPLKAPATGKLSPALAATSATVAPVLALTDAQLGATDGFMANGSAGYVQLQSHVAAGAIAYVRAASKGGSIAASGADAPPPPYLPDEDDTLDSLPPHALSYSTLRRSLLRWHVANLEYGCAKSVQDVSLQQWDQDDTHNSHDQGGHDFLPYGYDCFVRGMMQDIPVVYDAEVTTVSWAGESASAATAGPARVNVRLPNAAKSPAQSDELVVSADAVIVTVPIAPLQQQRPAFAPPLPSWKRSAVNAIGTGLLNKVILRFPTAFWRQDPVSAAAEAAELARHQAATEAAKAALLPPQPPLLAATSKPSIGAASRAPSGGVGGGSNVAAQVKVANSEDSKDLLASFGWGSAASTTPGTAAPAAGVKPSVRPAVGVSSPKPAPSSSPKPVTTAVTKPGQPTASALPRLSSTTTKPAAATSASAGTPQQPLPVASSSAVVTTGNSAPAPPAEASLSESQRALAAVSAAMATIGGVGVSSIDGLVHVPFVASPQIKNDAGNEAEQGILSVPAALACGPLRIVTFVPMAGLLAGFHLQPKAFGDAQLMLACALGMSAAAAAMIKGGGDARESTTAALVPAPVMRGSRRSFDDPKTRGSARPARALFTALAAVCEADGDMAAAASLMAKWCNSYPASADDTWSLPSTAATAAQRLMAALEAMPSAELFACQSAAEHAASLFALPPVDSFDPPASTSAAEAPTTSENSATAPASAAAAVPAADAAGAGGKAPLAATAAAGGSVGGSMGSDPAPLLPARKAAPPPAKPVDLPPSIALIGADETVPRGPSISAADDAFGRVLVGDAPAAVRRRGEAYMFWCMDRPSAGAGIRPVGGRPAAAEGEEGSGSGGAPVLIAMMAGDAAEWVEGASDAEVLSRVMGGLRAMFGAAAVPEPTSHVITRWAADRWAGMSYSYLKPHAHGLHYDLMAAPVGSQLFFAGEATNRHHPTTAAGAFDSGVREAVRLGRAWGKSMDAGVARVLAARAARLKAAGAALNSTPPLLPT